MKNLLLSLALLSLAAALPAQTPLIQNTTVREQNSNKKPVPDAHVIFEGAPAKFSDQDGKIRLAFQDKKPGAYTFLTEVTKAGYEIVNKTDLEKVKLSDSDQFGTDIILAKTGVVDAAKKDYYGISDKALLAGFEKEKRRLRNELNNTKLSEQQFEQQYKQVQEQYDRQKEALDALAEKFARVNFDDVDSLYRQALELFKAGEIMQCRQKLENANLIGRTNLRLQERERITGAKQEIARQEADNEKGIRQDIAALQLQAQTYLFSFEFGKAEGLFDQLFRLDSTDLTILQDAADFYQQNHRYEKALHLLPLIIAHPQAEDWQKANAYCSTGELYTIIGQLNLAMQSYLSFQKAYAAMLQANPDRPFYKADLAISYSKLGETHTALGNLDQALKYYEDYYKLTKELYNAYPNNVALKNGLAISYEKLGSTHTALGNLDKALKYYEDDLQLTEELYDAYPNNVALKNGLAISYSKLGDTHTALGNLDKALKYYEDEIKLFEELYDAYPNNVDFKNGLAISYSRLGDTHTALGNLDKALKYYEDDLQLTKELYDAYPINVAFKNGLAISYSKLGDTHTDLGNLNKALKYYEDEIKLFEQLYDAYPNNVAFKNGLAISYEKLGETHTDLGNLDKALKYYEDYNKLTKELYDAYPNNVNFKNGLAISYEKLGNTHTALGNLDKALKYYEDEIKLFEQLYDAYPNNVDFKNGLANSYSKLGNTHTVLSNLDKALKYYEDYNKLTKELYDAYPNSVAFKNGLAVSYMKLASIYLKTDLSKANTYLRTAEKYFMELHKASPQNVQFKQYLDIVQQVLASLSEETDVVSLLNIQNEPDTLVQYQLYSTLCDTLRQRVKNDPQQKAALADAINGRAWTGFFLKKFETVETDIREGMALGTDNKFLASNLAPALLLQGKYKAALAEYNKWKDLPFGEQGLPTYRDAFLDDLNTFEKAGIIPAARAADVAAVRKMLLKQ